KSAMMDLSSTALFHKKVQILSTLSSRPISCALRESLNARIRASAGERTTVEGNLSFWHT
ncbi:MAG: hypothetical protein ACI4QT_00245, partial [Kiritimatiellia bacterium]